MTIESPCRQVCRLGSDGLCDGCGRSVDEIAAWIGLSAVRRAEVMKRVRDWVTRDPAKVDGRRS